jgi:hypothetical protein
MTLVVSASPYQDQPYSRCLDRPEVDETFMALSVPGHLTVRLREGTSRVVAEEIAACLRRLPGTAWQVFVRDQ